MLHLTEWHWQHEKPYRMNKSMKWLGMPLSRKLLMQSATFIALSKRGATRASLTWTTNIFPWADLSLTNQEELDAIAFEFTMWHFKHFDFKRPIEVMLELTPQPMIHLFYSIGMCHSMSAPVCIIITCTLTTLIKTRYRPEVETGLSPCPKLYKM